MHDMCDFYQDYEDVTAVLHSLPCETAWLGDLRISEVPPKAYSSFLSYSHLAVSLYVCDYLVKINRFWKELTSASSFFQTYKKVQEQFTPDS